MPVFLDLDNTLVDRDAAFSRWVNAAIAESSTADVLALVTMSFRSAR